MDFRVWLLGMSLLLNCGVAVSADLEAGKKIVLQGNGKAATACSACHGAGGEGSATASFPRLAHLDADYLAKQLRDFQREQRKDAVMQPIAKALTEREIADVSAYFAAQASTAPPEKVDPALAARGARIALSGLWEKDLPACISCHGPGGHGVGKHFPALAGQHANYITQQLNAWRNGTRSNDPQVLMKEIAQRLSAAEIAAVSAYFASLPVKNSRPKELSP